MLLLRRRRRAPPHHAGAGKTTTLEGSRPKDGTKQGPQGDGLVHLAVDELFKMLNQKAAAVGAWLRVCVRALAACACELPRMRRAVPPGLAVHAPLCAPQHCAGDMVNQKRRMPSTKAFDFFLESSFLEVNVTAHWPDGGGPVAAAAHLAPTRPAPTLSWSARAHAHVTPCKLSRTCAHKCTRALLLTAHAMQVYNEGCHDLYQRGAASQANLPVFEDEMEGYQVRGSALHPHKHTMRTLALTRPRTHACPRARRCRA